MCAVAFFAFPAVLSLGLQGPEEAKNLAGRFPPPDSDPLSKVEFRKNSPASQGKGDNSQIYGRSHDAVIRVYDEAGNVIVTYASRQPPFAPMSRNADRHGADRAADQL